MIKRTLLLAGGLSFVGAAAAQPVPFDAPRRLPTRGIVPTAINGVAVAPGGGRDTGEVLYRNATPTFLFTPSTPHTLGGDIISFDPGPGGGTTGVITHLAIGFAVPLGAPVPMDFDVLITFWDDMNFTAPSGSPVHENQMGSLLRVEYRNVSQAGMIYESPSMAIPAPIPYDDDSLFFRVEFVEPGTTTRKPDNHVTFAFANSVATNGPSPGSSPSPPTVPGDTFYRDANGNGVLEQSDLRALPSPNRANVYLEITGEVGGACACDCDTSTGPEVCDIFDFLCFQNQYSQNDPRACDCDTSTGPLVCDIFDFLCFQNNYDEALNNGCP